MAEAWSAVPEWIRCYPCCIHQPELSLKPSSPQLVAMAEEIERIEPLVAAQP